MADQGRGVVIPGGVAAPTSTSIIGLIAENPNQRAKTSSVGVVLLRR
jgi:hypothetical protein